MSDWLHNLPVIWMALVVFGAKYIVAAVICAIVDALAVGERARAFRALSPGLLPPLGILFALFVAFTASQVWNDTDRANTAVLHEASALKAILVLSSSFPAEPEARIRSSIHQYIDEASTKEWPEMAKQTATLGITPQPLAEALRLSLSLTPGNKGQETAQREIITALETALDARRQRLIVSRSEVNLLKWCCLLVQAICAMVAIAIVHSDSRLTSHIATGIFATGVAASLLLIIAHDRPFIGELSVGPDPLLQVLPQAQVSRK